MRSAHKAMRTMGVVLMRGMMEGMDEWWNEGVVGWG